MVEEAPVLGRQHRLDHIVGILVERHGIVMENAAPPHLDAEAVLEGRRRVGFLQPLVAGGQLEGGLRQHHQRHAAEHAQRQRLAGEFDRDARGAAHREMLHEAGEIAIKFRGLLSGTHRLGNRFQESAASKRVTQPAKQGEPVQIETQLCKPLSAEPLRAPAFNIFLSALDERAVAAHSGAAFRWPRKTRARGGGAILEQGPPLARKGEKFWAGRTLEDFSRSEWESLCDGCGRCCLVKLEEEDTGEIFFTDVGCRLLDAKTARCADYGHRSRRVKDCIRLEPDSARRLSWLPPTCAYRLVGEGKDLPRLASAGQRARGKRGRGRRLRDRPRPRAGGRTFNRRAGRSRGELARQGSESREEEVKRADSRVNSTVFAAINWRNHGRGCQGGLPDMEGNTYEVEFEIESSGAPVDCLFGRAFFAGLGVGNGAAAPGLSRRRDAPVPPSYSRCPDDHRLHAPSRQPTQPRLPQAFAGRSAEDA